MFYNHLILSGTKMNFATVRKASGFYNHLILSGTKMRAQAMGKSIRFTIT